MYLDGSFRNLQVCRFCIKSKITTRAGETSILCYYYYQNLFLFTNSAPNYHELARTNPRFYYKINNCQNVKIQKIKYRNIILYKPIGIQIRVKNNLCIEKIFLGFVKKSNLEFKNCCS